MLCCIFRDVTYMYISVFHIAIYAGLRSHSMPNVLKTASRPGSGTEKGKTRKKEGEKDGSGKRKRSALEEIREVCTYTYTCKASLSGPPHGAHLVLCATLNPLDFDLLR